MATLQVRDLDDDIYAALKFLAKQEKRSLSQEVAHILEEYIKNPHKRMQSQTEAFLSLSGAFKDESADELISMIRGSRKNSSRFAKKNELFD